MGGFLDSLVGVAETLLTGAQSSLDEWTAELQRERLRLVCLLGWMVAVVLAGAMAVLLATAAVVELVPPSARIAVLAGLAAFYLALAAGMAVALRRRLARAPLRFSAIASLLALGQLVATAARAARRGHGSPSEPSVD